MSARRTTDGTAFPYFVTKVLRTRRVTPHLVRITVGGEGLSEFPYRSPDQWVKLFFPPSGRATPEIPEMDGDDVPGWYRRYLAMPDGVRPTMRTFTARALRPERGELDIEFVLHGDAGPASRWAGNAHPGDALGVLAAQGGFTPPEDPPWLLIAGDHTALPAIASILESLDDDERSASGTSIGTERSASGTSIGPVRALAFVELDDAADEQPLTTGRGVRLRWLHRRPDAAPGEALVEALRHTTFPLGTPYAWLAGEAGLVRSVRRHLVGGRQVPKNAISFTGYWRMGKAESDAYTDEELAEARG